MGQSREFGCFLEKEIGHELGKLKTPGINNKTKRISRLCIIMLLLLDFIPRIVNPGHKLLLLRERKHVHEAKSWAEGLCWFLEKETGQVLAREIEENGYK